MYLSKYYGLVFGKLHNLFIELNSMVVVKYKHDDASEMRKFGNITHGSLANAKVGAYIPIR